MKPDLPKLIDAIADGFSKALPEQPWHPVIMQGFPPKTYCNWFVNFVATAMGYHGFSKESSSEPMLANAMVDLMSQPGNGWLIVSNDVAQNHANRGCLVLAGWKNPAGDHGHVCIVRPGEMVMSGHWQKPAPRVANVGLDVFIDKSASFAFHNEPIYFVLEAMA